MLGRSVVLAALGLGMIGAAPAVAAPAWFPLGDLDQPIADPAAGSPQVAMDPGGDAVAVWQGSNGSNSTIRAAGRPAGGNFSAAADLSAPAENNGSPQVAMDQAGNAIAVWRRDPYFVQAAIGSADGGFGAPIDLSADIQFAADDPALAMNPAGNAIAVWSLERSDDQVVQAMDRPAGGSFGAAVDVSPAGEQAFRPDVAMNAAGEVIVTWSRHDGSASSVHASVRPAGGSFGAPVDLSTPGQDADFSQVALDQAGDAIVVWKRNNGDDRITQAAFRPAGGSFGAPVDLSVPSTNDFDPQVAMDQVGNAIVAWERFNGNETLVQGATRPAGGSFSAPFDLSAPGGDALSPKLAMNPAGDAFVVWYRGDDTQSIVQARARPAGGSFGAPVDLSPPDVDSFEPVVAMDQAGDAIAAWSHFDSCCNIVVQAAAYADRPTVPSTTTRPTTISPRPASPPALPELSPDNAFRFPRVRARKAGLTFVFDFPGAGTLDALATTRKLGAHTAVLRPGPHRTAVGRLHASAQGPGPRRLRLRINRRGRRILAIRHRLPVRLSLVFTPTGGQSSRQARKVTIRRAKR
jgi:hypothetical protein